MKVQTYVYGPVPSRRLGRSLGADLVPFKTCTYDCIYCQIGRTTNRTMQRREWAPVDTIVEQIQARLDSQPHYITLAGSGEPTLHSGIADIISRLKKITDVPIAVLTNGSLLWMPDVRDSLMQADLVLPSLDAGTDALFKYVNRPHDDITFDKMLEGLVKFRDEYSGKFWLEILLLGGVTTVEAQVNTMSHCIRRIRPDMVQLGTATRPPAEDFADPVPLSQLEAIAPRLWDNVEITAGRHVAESQSRASAEDKDVLELLRRRPCSIEDIAQGLGMHRNEVVKFVERLRSRRKIVEEPTNGGLYFKAVI